MDHNLIPPFVLRKAGFIVNDIPRIHCHDITKNSHSIISNDGDLRIPLRLHDVFSFSQPFDLMMTIIILDHPVSITS